MMSISRKNGYISANRELEKANILRLIFIKIVLFNVLLQPEKIDLPSHSQDHAVVCSNIRLVGNIVYELIIEIND